MHTLVHMWQSEDSLQKWFSPVTTVESWGSH